MKKILSFVAAMLVAVAVNAVVVNITPDGATDLRHAVRDVANAGDTIVLANGVYEQGGDYTIFNKNLVVKAAEGAAPVVKFLVPAQISGGATAEFIGIKFDMEKLHGQSWYEHLIYATDATDGNKLIFDGCEFYNDTLNNSTIYCSSSNKLDNCIVKNCYFYNIRKSCMFFENAGMKELKVINSTFANIYVKTGDDASYWAGNIFLKSATGANVLVDHCTFYNIECMNTDYGAVKVLPTVTPDPVVSNCIFAMPASYAGGRAIYNTNGAVKNCLTYNYTKDSGHEGVHSGPTRTNCIFNQDPLFKDAANADFTLGATSPALTAGEDGKAIGDPRWIPVPAPAIENGFYLIGKINGVTGWDIYGIQTANKFVGNPANNAEFMLNVTLAEGDEIKVVNVLDKAITAWFPGGTDNNYVIDAAHAGDKTVYFRPDYLGGDDWYEKCIYIAPNTGSAIDNANATEMSVKMIENGQVVIIKNGVKYNVLGIQF